MKPSCVELCAGCGGLALGLENSGFKTELVMDFDKSACETLRKNRPEWNVVHGDITKVTDWRSLLKDKTAEIDLLSAGIPCQAFSFAGKRLGTEDPRGQLYYSFRNAVNQFQPKVVLIENVKGLVSINNGQTLKDFTEDLSSMGYTVTFKVLKATDFEVPQKRERVIIVGTKGGCVFEFPKAIDADVSLNTVLREPITVPDVGVTYNEKKRRVMDLVPEGGCWVNLPEDVAKEYMGNSFYSGGGKRGIAKRLSRTEPSLTILTSPAQKQTERCHPTETRPLTVRESARIQTFPDDWVFCGGVGAQYKQIGNAVPVKLAEHVGHSIMNTIANFANTTH